MSSNKEPMELHGQNIIGNETSAQGKKTYTAFDPRQGRPLTQEFVNATPEEIDRALSLAEQAFHDYRKCSSSDIAAFLETIATEILNLGDQLIETASAESGLTAERLIGERARTTNQLRMFAGLVREGSWVDARIDRAQPDRKPLPKVDLRRILIPIGPVIVFGASNFPLAFSVAGGDTASALAARNPVIVKVHPAHPATSELVARALQKAIHDCQMPAGVFSLLHGETAEISIALVRHPLAKAVGFTGSQTAGRALFDAASQRPEPIPVYAEMGSVNPVFLLPGAVAERPEALAQGVKQSVTLGMGQFCTCPGLIVGMNLAPIGDSLRKQFAEAAPGTMLRPGILNAYQRGVEKLEQVAGVRSTRASTVSDAAKTEASPAVLETEAATFLANPELGHEVFGPSTVLVHCGSRAELEAVARHLEGSLTASVHGTDRDLAEHRTLIDILETKAGRLLFNGYPTGVEVCPSMNHGGPYPATSDVKFTSVGTAAIYRFARPICYQNFPQSLLPPELQDGNPANIWRTVDGTLTRDS